MDNRIVELEKVKVCRNHQQILDIDSLVIAEGELIALAGANGAGKSTLLQVINLLLPYQQGKITLFGQLVIGCKNDSVRRNSSMMFQDPLFVYGTVYDNVALPLKFRNCPPADIRRQVAAALEAFQCNHLTDRQANQLSGGEAQRAALARALVYQPRLLLLDEPFAALDSASRTAILHDLKQVAIENKLTVLLVSHNFNDVLYFADRAVVLEKGQIIQDAKPEVVLRRPATRIVANLVDMDNILSCQVEKTGQELVVKLGGGIEFRKSTPEIDKVAACCLPGDSLYILNEISALSCQPTVVVGGIITGIIPGIGAYKVLLKSDDLSLTIRATREQTLGLAIGGSIHVGFNPEEIQLV